MRNLTNTSNVLFESSVFFNAAGEKVLRVKDTNNFALLLLNELVTGEDSSGIDGIDESSKEVFRVDLLGNKT